MSDDPRKLEWPEDDSATSKHVFVETLTGEIHDAKWLYFTPYPSPDTQVSEQISNRFDSPINIEGRRFSLKSWEIPRDDIAVACNVFFTQRCPELFILAAQNKLTRDDLLAVFKSNTPASNSKLLYFDDNIWVPQSR